MTGRDEFKFVVCDRADYDWALAFMAEHDLAVRAPVLFSPSHGQLDPGLLADWMLADQVPARLQIQMHKYLWGDVRGR
jgi:7-carboxy-7-deazaguanine synthase